MKKNTSENLPIYSNVSSNNASQPSYPTATDVYCNTADGFRSNAAAKTSHKEAENENENAYEIVERVDRKSNTMDENIETKLRGKKESRNLQRSAYTLPKTKPSVVPFIYNARILAVLAVLFGLATVGLLIGVIVLATKQTTPSTTIESKQTSPHQQNGTTTSVETLPATLTTTVIASQVTNPSDFQNNKLAFMASCHSDVFPSSSTFLFDNVSINEGLTFDIYNNSFTVPEDGFYWFHLSVGIPAYNFCNFSMTTDNLTLSVIRTKNESSGLDVTSRDDLLLLKKGQRLAVSTAYLLQSDWLGQTSWIGFRLDTIMSPFVAFSVGYTQSLMSGYQYIPFNTIFADSHGAWKSNSSSYITPITGLYFLSFHVSATPTYPSTQNIYLHVNKATVSSIEMIIDSGQKTGSETLGISLLSVLYKNDAVQLYGNQLFSDNTYQISLSGFLCHLSTGEFRVAWFVTNNNLDIGYVNPVRFQNVIANIGYGWHETRNTFTTFVSGLYYIYFSGGSFDRNKFNLQIWLNNSQPITSIQRNSTTSFGLIYSKAILLRLNLNDELRVVQPGGATTSWLYNAYFMGFRLFV